MQNVFRRLERILHSDVILASHTVPTYGQDFMQVGLVVSVGNDISALCIGGNDGGDDDFSQLSI